MSSDITSRFVASVIAASFAGGCSSSGRGDAAGDGAAAEASRGSGTIGDRCTPGEEDDPSFLGFSLSAVNIEVNAPQCQARLCLVNHFQGRVSCPYGQQADAAPRAGTVPCSMEGGAFGCCTPDTMRGVDGLDTSGSFVSPSALATVRPQCADRTSDETVYCSCRCAGADGGVDDGGGYCTCPGGFACTQLVAPIGTTDQFTGAYCIKAGTRYDPNAGACSATCDPSTRNCGTAQLP